MYITRYIISSVTNLVAHKLHVTDNCCFLLGHDNVEIILSRRQGTYAVMVWHKLRAGMRELVFGSDFCPTVREAFENMLDKSADAADDRFVQYRAAANSRLEGRVGPDNNDDDDTPSIISSYLDDDDYQSECSIIGYEDEANFGGDGSGQEGSTRAGDVTVVTPSCNDQVRRDAPHTGFPKPSTETVSPTIPGLALRMPTLTGTTAVPTGSMKPESGLAGPRAGHGQATWAVTSLPAGVAPPTRPLPPCPGNLPADSRAPSYAAVCAQGKKVQRASMNSRSPSNQAPGLNNVGTPSSDAPSSTRLAAVNNYNNSSSQFSKTQQPVTSGSSPATLKAPALPSLGTQIQATNTSQWDYRLAIAMRRQPRGDAATQYASSISPDSDYVEPCLVLKGRLTRDAMRIKALSFIREHPQRFDAWLDIFSPLSSPNSKNRTARSSISVSHLCTTITQAIFPVMKRQASGAVLTPGHEVLDVSVYDCEDLSALCSTWVAKWRAAGMGHIPWIPEFEAVVSDGW